MRVRLSRYVRVGSKALLFATPFLLAASVAIPSSFFSSSLERLSAEYQSGTEIHTAATPAASPVPVGAPGGAVVYDKTLNIGPGVAYITFSAQGDSHEIFNGNTPIPGTGGALLMSASITDSSGAVTVCQPMASSGGSALFGGPWMTLIKLPDGGGNGNCNDGGGGPADCHDNAFSFSCCALLGPSNSKGGVSRDVKINMASSNGAEVFYENSTIYIDRSPNADGSFCSKVGTAPHSAPTPSHHDD
jgi:hypothetical protein